jgi:hypothetical protein
LDKTIENGLKDLSNKTDKDIKMLEKDLAKKYRRPMEIKRC